MDITEGHDGLPLTQFFRGDVDDLDVVKTLSLPPARRAQHFIGLADPWRHTEKHLQPPTLAARSG